MPPTFTPLAPGTPVLAAVSPGPDLAAAGFAEREYAVAGTALRYEPAAGGASGAGAAVPTDPAPYRTRVVVRAPVDPAHFSGVAVLEWLNVSSGADAAPDYTYLGEEVVRRGHAWVGVSAQLVGVVGGPPSIGGDPSVGLRGTDPGRYGDLRHPGDGYAYDIFSQVGAALSAPGGPLADRRVDRRIAVGESQSAFALTTYLNEVAPTAGVFDAYLVHSRGRFALGLGRAGGPVDLQTVRFGEAVPIRDDLAVPVIVVETETDVLSPRFRYVDARQADGPLLRTWEVAGTAHADRWQIGDLEDLLGCPDPVNRGQQAYVLRAALRWLETWSGEGAPPRAPVLATSAEGAFELDEVGNVLGGVRTPCVEVPAQALSGLPSPDAPILCSLFGTTHDLPGKVLRERYASVEAYLKEYAAATDAAIAAGFLLVEDRAAVLAEARPDLVAAALDRPLE
ncbi:alpha/beta hydrolase domain-containing protein [Nocardioides sp. MH1]|uniref:alpha/beta hydrolase domain-containing protein n=1 Tax=Nocardioides sp. MH1 TaxID=3242490 RepID=UPI003521CE76